MGGQLRGRLDIPAVSGAVASCIRVRYGFWAVTDAAAQTGETIATWQHQLSSFDTRGQGAAISPIGDNPPTSELATFLWLGPICAGAKEKRPEGGRGQLGAFLVVAGQTSISHRKQLPSSQ